MVTTREFVEQLLESQEGVALAFHELKQRARDESDLRNAAIIGLSEWRDLESDTLTGVVSREDQRVRKAQLTQRILGIADRIDLVHPIEAEVESLIRRHQQIAEQSQGKDVDAVESMLESAGASAGTLAVLGIGTRTFSVRESVTRLLQLQRQVCAVVVDSGHVGTGFLVSDQHVLTNRHVLDEVLARHGRKSCLFDHSGERDLSSLPRYDLHADLVAKSPTGVMAQSEPRDLDYALLRLARPVERDRQSLTPSAKRLNDKDPVIILHHPQAHSYQPLGLQTSVGAIRNIDDFTKRIAYTAATAPGSSGAPILSGTYELVGLHHHRQRHVNSHGIPIWAIMEDLELKGFDDFAELTTGGASKPESSDPMPPQSDESMLENARPSTVPMPQSTDAGPARGNPESEAVKLWRQKLAFLQKHEALTVDPGAKFKLQHDIAEAKRKIDELS